MEFIDVRVEVLEAPVPLWRLIRVPADLPWSDMMKVMTRCVGLSADLGYDRRVLRNGEPVIPDIALEIDPTLFEQLGVAEVVPGTDDEVIVEQHSGGLWQMSIRAVAPPRPRPRPITLIQLLDGEGATLPWGRVAHMGHYVDLLRAREDRHHPDHRWVWRVLPTDFNPVRFDLAAAREGVATVHLRARLDGPQPREIRSLIADFDDRHPEVPPTLCIQAIGLALTYRAAHPDRVAALPDATLLAAAATWVIALFHSVWGSAPAGTDLSALTTFWECAREKVVPLADDLIDSCVRRGSGPEPLIAPRRDFGWEDDEDLDDEDFDDEDFEDEDFEDEVDLFAVLRDLLDQESRGPRGRPGR